MTESIQTYCSATRQLAHLEQAVKADLFEIKEIRKAANSILLDLQTEEEMVAKLPEGCFSVRVKVKMKRPAQSVEVLQKMEEFWESGQSSAWKQQMLEDPEANPVESLVEAVVSLAWPPAVEKRTLEIKKAKETCARIQDLPETPCKNLPLLSSIVEAKRIMSDRTSMVKEDKKKLREQCKEAEQKIIPELSQLPKGYIRRVDLRDSSAGLDESFYLRLKPPRKKPLKKFSCSALEKTMKGFLDENVPALSRQEIIDRIASPRFGTAMCREIATAFAHSCKEEAASSSPRVVLDRLKEPQRVG